MSFLKLNVFCCLQFLYSSFIFSSEIGSLSVLNNDFDRLIFKLKKYIRTVFRKKKKSNKLLFLNDFKKCLKPNSDNIKFFAPQQNAYNNWIPLLSQTTFPI